MLSRSRCGTMTEEWFPNMTFAITVLLRLLSLAPAAADLCVVGKGGESTPFEPASQADQDRGPLGAAVMHELDRLPPVRVREQQHCLSASAFQIEGDGRADPFRWAVNAPPLHAIVRRQLDDLHDGRGLGLAEEEPQLGADLRVAFHLSGPELGETVLVGQHLVYAVLWRCDSYAVTNIGHCPAPLSIRVPTNQARVVVACS